MAAYYPAHWEADVVLADGGTAHVRPIRPADAERLLSFYSRLSEESIYFRFFGPRPRLSEREVTRFTNVDYVDRVALIATIGEEMVAVIRYDKIQDGEAEVAFLVEDAHQGRGVASVLLEHLAATAREHGIGRFVADVLPANQKMMAVLRQAGYTAQSRFADGVVRMTLDLTPTETSQEVTAAREHRAESRSIERLLTPGSVAVVGASRGPGGVGQTVLRNLLAADFAGPVYPVHREARALAGVRAYPSVTAIDGEVDLAVLAVPAEGVRDLVVECAEKGVRGLVVVSSGFGETGPEGRARQDELVRIARSHGLRVVGPNCLGIANTDPGVRLNATLAATIPARGRVGFFSQSGALGTTLLHRVAQRNMGISSFVSAGNRADVSGNDLLQFWEEDPATEVILLYLESIGNPRKFARLTRRVSRRKPVVVVKSGGTTQGVPIGHAAPALKLPDSALSSLFEQAGVIRVDDLIQQFDVAQLLAYQPLPAGPRVGVVSNSDALALLALDACLTAGLDPRPPVNLGAEAGAAAFGAALSGELADGDTDAVVVIYMPPIPGDAAAVAAELLRNAAEAPGKPVLATFEGRVGMLPELSHDPRGHDPGRGSIPSYAAPEEAVRALAHVVRHAQWRERPLEQPPIGGGEGTAEARDLVRDALAGRAGPVEIDAARLLAPYGVTVWPAPVAATADEAVEIADRLGWPVVVKAVGREAAARAGAVRLGLTGPEALRQAYAGLSAQLGPGAPIAVQRMAPQPGVPALISAVEHPSVGPVVSFGLGEVTARLLGDRGYRLAPLSTGDAAELIRSIRAAPLLFGEYGYPPVAVGALRELLVLTGRMADELPELDRLDLDPVLVGESGVTVLGGRAVLRVPQGPRPDDGPRRLR
ncbi:GNAT family N-acetyltransferase [Spongiactinospora gelatinilytica]|uniref:GNAT family N-acetyltransferase n=1 Tax=Spongiactinospora gelatinilytica TaxID=2666298 RepID=A0A2W2FBQ1_9ACTN|nr:bifunctional GNAT family N-acetyltransferase/acetate--CoA ligase family protein [Spongiactinospora gelatinilytica]PZG33051.1 GNAT family N-acetyltransferase [Spongiactinospora gelatinilytica]